jgi:hypothetical protein
MKKLIVLVTILSLSLTAFSQQDTTIKVKCLPISIFKQIAQDLLKGDSAISQLKLSEQQIIHFENKVLLKDSIINTMKVKEFNYDVIHTFDDEIIEHMNKLYVDKPIVNTKSKNSLFVNNDVNPLVKTSIELSNDVNDVKNFNVEEIIKKYLEVI